MIMSWRTGHKVPINVYEGSNPGRPVCQCHNEEDAALIVEAVNRLLESGNITDPLKPERLERGDI
jgi:hypothetical protein